MKTLRLKIILLFTLLFSVTCMAGEVCDIYIHGYTATGENYFGDLPRQVVWNSQSDIKQAAKEVSDKILGFYAECEAGQPMVLRPHSYGAAIVQYILARGYEFKDIYPSHKYVQIYRNTVEVYAYTGAYHGTPIMDLVCSSRLTRAIAGLVGRTCVKALSTAKVYNVAFRAQTPGIATHLISSSDRGGVLGIPGFIISKHLVGFWSFLRGARNQNDNTLPLYSTKACNKKVLMRHKDQDCGKLDQNYFIDLYHTTDQHHFEFLKDKDFMGKTREE